MGLCVLLLVAALTALARGQGPMITEQPSNQTDIPLGENTTFTVTVNATGGIITYQWQYGGRNITDTADMYSGTTTSTLTVITVAASDEGAYTCVVSNENGTVTSAQAFLTVVIDCGSLPNPGNGSVSTSNTTRGGIATYSCDTGFNLDGSMTRTCQIDGDWSGTPPTCDIVNCGGPPNPSNGAVNTSSGTTFGDTATYSCNTGYNLNGTNTRTCQANGNWSGNEPACDIVTCPALSDPDNGMVNVPSNTFMSNATYTCVRGHNLTGDATRTCEANGEWSGSVPVCTLINCGNLPGPDNGLVTITIGNFGSNASYTCETGYNLNGDMTRMCQDSGDWSGTAPTCDPVDCGSLDDPTDGAVNTSSGTTFMMNATYSCDFGYNLNGTNTRTCQADRMWSGSDPTCDIVTCPALSDPNNGMVNVLNNNFGTVANYTCNTGYMLTGDVIRVCEVNGDWSGSEPTCTAVDCGSLSDPSNGMVDVTTTTFTSNATYTCNTGYTLTGDMTRTCEASGNWSTSEPTCTAVDCGVLTDPSNGAVNTSSGTTFTMTATYTCNTGYNLTGDMTRTCEASGNWSTSEPTCDLTCEDLILTNGMVVYNDTTIPRAVGSTANYSCDTGYDLTLGDVRVCTATGWVGTVATCMAVDCGDLTDPINGTVDTSSGTTFNMTATYTCDTGYTLTGYNTRTCGSDGVWMPQAPICNLSSPSITTQPGNTAYLIPGNTATFTVMSGELQLSYQWQVNGADINDTAGRYSGTTMGTLTVLNVADADSALMFTCVITNPAGSITSMPAQILILSLPEVTIMVMDRVVGVGGNVMISCSAVSDDALVTVGLTTTASNMADLPGPVANNTMVMVELMNVAMDRAGNYTCTATNARGPVTSTGRLYVVAVEPIADQSVPTGNNATFICVAVGAPSSVMYNWTHDLSGSVAFIRDSETADRAVGVNTNMLTIMNVGVQDEEGYRCTVSVDGVVLGFSPAMLSVVTPFFNQTLLPEYLLTAGDNLTLTCIGENPVGAESPLFIRWRFDDTFFNESDPRITNMMIGSNQLLSQLLIPNIQSSYRGEFVCYLSNRRTFESRNAVSSGTNVTVFFTPEPSFPAGGYRFQAGTNNDVECTIQSIPMTTFAGLFEVVDGVEILRANVTQPDNMPSVKVKYTIMNIQLDRHNRVFVCRATNVNGNVSLPTTIQVFGVPDQIDHSLIVTTPISLASMSISFPAPSDNNAPITAYTYMLCQGTCANSATPTTTMDYRVSGGDTVFTIGDLIPNSVYTLRVAAVNEAGNGPTPTNDTDAHTFNSSTSADGTPINLALSTTAVSETSLLITWNFPPLGFAADVVTESFNVTWTRVSDVTPSGSSTVQSLAYQITGLTPGGSYVITVVAIYSSPMLMSDPARIIEDPTPGPIALLNPDDHIVPLISAMAEGPSGVSPTSMLIQWIAPDVPFVRRYIGSIGVAPFTSSSTRRKRQTDTIAVNTTDNFLTVNDFPGAGTNTPNIAAEIGPPGSEPILLNVFPVDTTFIAPETTPTAPAGFTVVANRLNPYRSLDLSWTLPSQPNGVLRRCTITETSPNSGSIPLPGNPVPTSHTLNIRDPDTLYTFELTCANIFTSPAITMSGRTSVGVAPPQLELNGFSNNDNNVVAVTVTTMSTFGPHSYYQVIVSNVLLTNTRTGGNNGIDTADILPSNLLPFSEGTNGYYVTWVANSNTGSGIVMIGAQDTTVNGGTTYINQALQPGQYYIFVRLYNNGGIYSDSVVVTTNIPTPLPVAAVIVPIALLAIILLVVLVALLIFAVWRLQGPPRRRAYIPGEKGMSDGKGRRSNNIELRRTRLFAPMLNVGSPDVFTSAGQPTTLMCEASGTPAPDVTWTRDGEPLDKERFIQLADSSLFVNDTDLQDEGEYVVTAINSAGQAEQLVKVTVLRPVPPEPDADHPPVKAGDFTEKLALLRANDDEALEDEYSEIELDWTFTSYAAKLNINKNKNRYINIIPYDHSRVVLSLQDSTPGSDYINGSYVDGYNHSNEYIATQGPIPSTFPDFWRMVWEMDSPTIVMVTNLKEEDKVKCHQYWPSYGTTTYGNIQVTLKEVENLAEYSIRTFTVTPLAGQSRAQMPVREVRQFHFLVWPDHGVPVYATALLTFRKRVLRYHPAKRGPMVVHCSAGVGRTGTFITIDVCLNQVEGESNLDIFNYVRHMRFRRNYMVQTASQYVFIHDAVLESIMCGDNSIPAPELKSKLQSLVEVNADTGKSTFELQFETLNSTSPADDEFDCSVAQLPDNAAKNRFKEHLPSNDCRVVLSSEDDQCDYICASALDGYRHRNNFIVTQAPLTETVGDFWRMVWEQKSAAIIMLTQLEEDGQEMSVKYWPGTTGEAGVFGGYQLELSEDEKNKGDYITRRFKLSPVDNPQESRMVTQFHFTCWSKKTPPEGTHSILDLIDELQRVQRKSGNGPITVHCDNGLGRSGAFCTLYTVLERVKAEQVVDVFQAIKTLRIQRVGLMESLDEYIFVHKAVVEFLESFSDYQNFK